VPCNTITSAGRIYSALSPRRLIDLGSSSPTLLS
jgi:hypothetical protein